MKKSVWSGGMHGPPWKECLYPSSFALLFFQEMHLWCAYSVQPWMRSLQSAKASEEGSLPNALKFSLHTGK